MSEEQYSEPGAAIADNPTKGKRGQRFNPGEYLEQFTALVKEKKSQEEICDMMGLNRLKYLELYQAYVEAQQPALRIPVTSSPRTCKVQSNGFLVSTAKINALGLGSIFKKGAVLKFEADDNTMKISLAEEAPNN